MKSLKMLVAAVVMCSASAFAQTAADPSTKPLTDQDIAMLRQDVSTAKMDVITHTMQFTDKEAAAFWPVYEGYAAAQKQVGDQKIALIKDYAQNYDTIDDAKATSMSQKMFSIDAETVALRQKWFPKFVAVLGAKRAAKFMQVDNRLTMIMNLQIASVVPLIP
jgi:Spy/CpxP family protein refolding chaperone